MSATGTLFPPAFGVTEPSVSTAAGYSIYNGDGTGTDYVTFTVNGVNQNVHPLPQQLILSSQTVLEPKPSCRSAHILVYTLHSMARG